MRRIIGEYATDPNKSKANLNYKFVVGGTKVRYATMTPDFESKTRPHALDSRPGAGGLLFVDTRRPRPGIEAREYDKDIAKDQQPKFKKRGMAAMARIRKVSGHAI